MVSDDSGSFSAPRKARLSLLRQRKGEGEGERLQRLLRRVPTDEWRLLPLPDSDVLGAGLLAAVRSARETGLLRVRSELSEAGFEEELRRVLSACSDSEPILTALSRVSQIGLLEIRLGALQILLMN